MTLDFRRIFNKMQNKGEIVFNWIILRWGFLIWELIFIYCGLFVLILVVFFCVVSSFTTFRPNFTSGLLQVIFTATSDRNEIIHTEGKLYIQRRGNRLINKSAFVFKIMLRNCLRQWCRINRTIKRNNVLKGERRRNDRKEKKERKNERERK